MFKFIAGVFRNFVDLLGILLTAVLGVACLGIALLLIFAIPIGTVCLFTMCLDGRQPWYLFVLGVLGCLFEFAVGMTIEEQIEQRRELAKAEKAERKSNESNSGICENGD